MSGGRVQRALRAGLPFSQVDGRSHCDVPKAGGDASSSTGRDTPKPEVLRAQVASCGAAAAAFRPGRASAAQTRRYSRASSTSSASPEASQTQSA